MAQLDIPINSDPRTKARTPLLLDVQTDLLSELATRLVVPLRPGGIQEPWVISRLHPVITVGEERYVAVVSEMAGIPTTILGEIIADARDQRTEILSAIDLLITGF
ncbi:MAG: CcdB family protein [Alkalispirochaeta sp.]